MNKISKALTIFSLYFAIYLMTGMILTNVHNGNNRLGEFGRYVSEPIDMVYSIVSKYAQTRDLSAIFQSDKYVKYSHNDTINNLTSDLFILHDCANNQGFEVINLKDQSNRKLFHYPNDFKRPNANSRTKLTLNNESNIIFGCLGNQLLVYPLDNSIKPTVIKYNNFKFHHRIESFGNYIFANVLRTISIQKGLREVADEGFAKFDNQGQLIEIWWLSEHLDEIKDITPIGRLVSPIQGGRSDPFHINDVEVAILPKNRQSTTNIDSADIFISVRHFNAILWLKSNKIYKILQGSYNQQHDVDVINDSTISISNNNSGAYHVYLESLNSNIILQNVSTLKETTICDSVGFASYTEGQSQFLPSNRILIENQNSNELIVVKNNTVVFKNGIKSSSKSSYHEILSWAPAFDYNPIIK